MGDEIAMRFVGGRGQWHPGIPARDLTADEVARWPEVEASRLYAFVTPPEGDVLVAGGGSNEDEGPAAAGVTEEAGDE